MKITEAGPGKITETNVLILGGEWQEADVVLDYTVKA
jgi:hypothetical protein